MDRGAWRSAVHEVRKQLVMTEQLNNNYRILIKGTGTIRGSAADELPTHGLP